MGSLGNCCCGCLIHEDLFARSPGTPLRGSWCDEEGDYEIDDGTAKCLVAGAIAILNIQHPVPDESMIAMYKTIDEIEDSGQIYRILVNVDRTTSGDPVVCDAVDYYFAEFERNGTNTSVIRLGVSSGGVESILKEDDIVGLTGTTRTFKAVISDKEFCASVTSAVLSIVATTHSGLFAGGYWCGFSLDTIDMRIDDFRFEKHHTTDAACDACLCTCESTEFPPLLNVRIYPDPSNCVRLDLLEPCEFDIEYDRVNGAWIGSGMCCDEGQEWEIEFSCPPEQYDGFTDLNSASMGITIGCTNSCSGCGGPNYPSSASCDPICFTYGPYNVSATDLTCLCSSSSDIFTRGSCDFYVEICEPV